MQRYLVGLECLRCGTERRHTVTYLGSVLASATCTVCGETLRPRTDVLVADYVRDFEHRLARKPGRMFDEARRHPVSFVFHYLPRGLVKKPREVFAEWETLLRLNAAAAREPGAPDRAAEPTSAAR